MDRQMDNIPVIHSLTTLSGFSPTGSTGPQQQIFLPKEENIYVPTRSWWVNYFEHKRVRFC
jgi:hypothetical protein